MAKKEHDWSTYYARTAGRSVRPFLKQALSLIAAEQSPPHRAIDLGCGAGAERDYLLERNQPGQATSGPKNWHVFDFIIRQPPKS